MKTKIVEIKHDGEQNLVLKEAGEIIKAGGLVAFPTETVYGLGGDALNPESACKIYAAKGRPSDNPLIVHISDLGQLNELAEDIPEEAWRLAEAFWPGPLTMVLQKSERVPKETTGGLDTVAVRMPDHPAALEFIRQAGGFVAAPSANLSGRPSPTSFKYVIEDMSGRIEMILAGEDSRIGLESTIVDLTSDTYVILRPGYITRDMLEKVLGRVETDPTLMDGSCTTAPRAPGMRYRHYAPKGELTLVKGEEGAVARRIAEEIRKAKAAGKKTGIICTKESFSHYQADSIKCLGGRRDEEAIAHHLYRILREFDEEGVEIILSESFSEYGMGQAIMNRLLKAAGYRVIQL
ncbi:MAG: threonylcarbamoyl-AMP synthase [Lachnospiraceae bacterium]|nr:threonylcarbamoyl-AMP synthase [Lachnospiraceae bacterium]